MQAQAGLFSAIGSLTSSNRASAEDMDKNSQNMALLQANVSPLALLREKDEKNDKKSNSASVSLVQEDENVVISDNALVPATSWQSISEVEDIESIDEVSVYVVHKGDTIGSVAKLFDTSEDAILSTNDLKKGDKLKEGDVLLVLPSFDGVEHTVKKNETLASIAKLYKVDKGDILFYNDIQANTKLVVGEKLMIPGGSLAEAPAPKTTKPKSGSPIVGIPKIDVSGYFIHPLPNSKRVRGVIVGSKNKRHDGVDFAAPTGTPIRAVASGRALIARTGRNGGYGTLVVLQHNNGTQSLYAHLSRLGVSPGEEVNQGDIIGYVGNTGHSFGSHLHLEIKGAINPF